MKIPILWRAPVAEDVLRLLIFCCFRLRLTSILLLCQPAKKTVLCHRKNFPSFSPPEHQRITHNPILFLHYPVTFTLTSFTQSVALLSRLIATVYRLWSTCLAFFNSDCTKKSFSSTPLSTFKITFRCLRTKREDLRCDTHDKTDTQKTCRPWAWCQPVTTATTHLLPSSDYCRSAKSLHWTLWR